MKVIEYGKALYKIKRYEALHTFKKQPLQFNETVQDIVKTLNEKGYVVLESYFSEEQCTQVRNEINRLLIDKSQSVQVYEDEADNRLFGANHASDLINELFWTDELLTSIRNCYYEHDDIVGCTMAARIDATPNNLGSGGGWHRDMIYGKQIKSIAYFSDVEMQHGPFQYLENSHHKSSILDTISKLNFDAFHNRFTEEEIEQIEAIGDYSTTTFTGKAGTLLLVDTTSIHRGMPILEGSRYALTNYWFESKIPAHIQKLIYKK